MSNILKRISGVISLTESAACCIIGAILKLRSVRIWRLKI